MVTPFPSNAYPYVINSFVTRFETNFHTVSSIYYFNFLSLSFFFFGIRPLTSYCQTYFKRSVRRQILPILPGLFVTSLFTRPFRLFHKRPKGFYPFDTRPRIKRITARSFLHALLPARRIRHFLISSTIVRI